LGFVSELHIVELSYWCIFYEHAVSHLWWGRCSNGEIEKSPCSRL